MVAIQEAESHSPRYRISETDLGTILRVAKVMANSHVILHI